MAVFEFLRKMLFTILYKLIFNERARAVTQDC